MKSYIVPPDIWQMDFQDFLATQEKYPAFQQAADFVASLEWSNSVWLALRAGHRPPENRVAEMLKLQAHLKPYLPPEIAVDYPSIPNPYFNKEIHERNYGNYRS